MNKALAYIIPPIFYFTVSYLGRLFTSRGVPEWYDTIKKPSFTPPGYVIGIVWTVIFILSALSMVFFLKQKNKDNLFIVVVGLYIANGVFNVLWSYLFFVKHYILLSVIDSFLIGLTVLLIILLLWKDVKISSVLLSPYLLWVSFATYLTYVIFRLN